ncbi:endoribonuclease ZC3H12A-like [Corythoichthys intestinalis]|uniref:endoribonuclease ZC3H12A-like n=1 Tax=Corythoichthys intestinalis TaxID=161448 RepID=UPI0025A5FA63|nr:endoribonuclease ZC3H12A-like [Corythoichthys intestinalis]
MEPDPSVTLLNYFCKLGFPKAQVQAALEKYGPDTDTDTVLAELVRMNADARSGTEPVTTVSVLLTNPWTAEPTVTLPLAQRGEEGGGDKDVLRPIVIDGSNVAMSHGNKEVFSCKGIQLAVDFFLDRGHTAITVFVPSWRKEQPRPNVPISDQKILEVLEKKKYLTFTPSRWVDNKRVVCNDDKFIVELAFETGGVIVSNDMYRDLQVDKPEWKRCINERLLMYSFVNDRFMVPDDPLGRDGPTLENFLRWIPKTTKKMACPYGKKCTFGLKCKYFHPERAYQPNCLLADSLREEAKRSSAASDSSRSLVGVQNFVQVEEARKLSLELEKSSLKKDKVSPCSKQKKKNSLTSSDHGSYKQLDSGVGSMETPLPTSVGYKQKKKNSLSSSEHGSYKQLDSGVCSMETPSSERNWSIPSSGGYHSKLHSLSRSAPPCLCHSHVTSQDHHGSLRRAEPADAAYREKRNAARKKLLATFSAKVVDAAMSMYPKLVDPVKLAENIWLASHNKI